MAVGCAEAEAVTRAERIAELRSTLTFYADLRARHSRICGCGKGGECPAAKALDELQDETRAAAARLAERVAA